MEGLEAAGRGQNLETEFAQGSADDLDVGLLVIHNEQAASVRFHDGEVHLLLRKCALRICGILSYRLQLGPGQRGFDGLS